MPAFACDERRPVFADEDPRVSTRSRCTRCNRRRRAARVADSVDPIATIRTEGVRLRGSAVRFPPRTIRFTPFGFPWCVAAAGLGIGEAVVSAAAVDIFLPGANPFVVGALTGVLTAVLALFVVKCLHQSELDFASRVTAAILGLAASAVVVAALWLACPAINPWQQGNSFDQVLVTFSLLQILVCDGAIGLALLSAATAQG
jgi:hypothetical protein